LTAFDAHSAAIEEELLPENLRRILAAQRAEDDGIAAQLEDLAIAADHRKSSALSRRRAVLAREQRHEGRDGPRLRDGTRGARVGHSDTCEGRGRASLGRVLTIVEQRDERRDAS